MKVRGLVAISLALNLVLAWALLRKEFPSSPRETSAHSPAANLSTQKTSSPAVIVRRQFFSWGEVESEDFPTYIANLRAIGCPEQTIRDLITAEINQLYARRRQAAQIVTNDLQWWLPEPNEAIVREAFEKAAGLEEERRALLVKLLGPVPEEPALTPTVPLTGPVLSRMSEERRRQVQEISQRSSQRLEEWVRQQQENGKPPDSLQLARLRQQTREELARVLNPLELEEYLLRYSHHADTLRGQFKHLKLSPEDFRALFRATDALEQQLQLLGSDPAQAKRREELEKQKEAAFRQVLGGERFARHQLQQDPLYQKAQAAAQQAQIPHERIGPLYEIERATQVERARIMKDSSLDAEQREQALQAMQKAQAASLRQLLGEELFERLPRNFTAAQP